MFALDLIHRSKPSVLACQRHAARIGNNSCIQRKQNIGIGIPYVSRSQHIICVSIHFYIAVVCFYFGFNLCFIQRIRHF